MTYSIVARDPGTGELGVGTQTHFFGVGALLPWAEAGVGAVATQAFVNVGHGPHGLELLRAGASAPTTVDVLVEGDPDCAYRQLGVVDAQGRVGTHTGASCAPHAGSARGEQVTVQGNMLAGPDVCRAALAAFESADGDLADRILAGLHAAEARGGDVRGRQSAALLVVSGRRSTTPWTEVVVDLRVDDHADPLAELSRLLPRARAFAAVGGVMFARGLALGPFEGVGPDELEERLRELAQAAEVIGPENREADFWRAVLLARAGRYEEAAGLFAEVVAFRPALLRFAEGLAPLGFLDDKALAGLTSRAGERV
ncbi:DUF1028 domain-containing protein [Prauserella flavalba]|uniref:DUF1028 domain-containing protein n=1 Tax=Prauserella flavalba TaxID=1477506 RepID=A0A318LNG2_9PSEU|nr:DUF1028 domain-containing protein [Prauserella flavalba]PXY18761.1 hypothetical protein BA062_34735 [Prauserella flavalba]